MCLISSSARVCTKSSTIHEMEVGLDAVLGGRIRKNAKSNLNIKENRAINSNLYGNSSQQYQLKDSKISEIESEQDRLISVVD